MKKRFSYFLITACLLIGSSEGFAHSGGEVFSTAPTAGCGGDNCHFAVNSNTIARFDGLADSVVMTPGSVMDITFVVSHPTAVAAGTNIALKTTAGGNFNTSSGGLETVEGGNLQAFGGELTHKFPNNLENGSASFAFRLVAPTEPGVYFLRAVANAVNRNSVPDAGDSWNFAPTLRVRVSIADGVDDEADATLARLGISPVPAHDAVTLTTPSIPGSVYTVNVLDLTGTMIYTDVVTSSDNILRYVWNGATSTGIQAPPGSYVLALSGNGRVQHGRAVLLR